MTLEKENLVILGTGPAGLTAAIYSARANLSPLCIEGEQPGGQLTLTTEVENYPGFAEPILGPELMNAFREQAKRFQARFMKGNVLKVDLLQTPFLIQTQDHVMIQTKALIIATGAHAKWLGIPGEKKFLGRGVSACATCDGYFFKNLNVVVIGGGDTAMEEALFLTRFAKSVSVIHRRDKLRASKIMQDKALKHPKIQFIWNSIVEEISGDQVVDKVIIKNLKTQTVQEMEIQGVFIAIGHQPNTAIFNDQLKCDAKGYIHTQFKSTLTSIPGVFAAGDVADSVYRQAITAAGTGCIAAIDAERFLEERK